MDGVPGTLYEGEQFELQFKFSNKYPFDSPEVIRYFIWLAANSIPFGITMEIMNSSLLHIVLPIIFIIVLHTCSIFNHLSNFYNENQWSTNIISF